VADADDLSDSRALLSRRLDSSLLDCSQYYCVNHALDSQFKKIDKKSYAELTPCENAIFDNFTEICASKDKCYVDGGAYWEEKVSTAKVTSGGFLGEIGEPAGGIIGIVLAILFLCLGLMGLCKALQKIFLHNAHKVLKYATKLNDYVAILIGIGVTMIVQSSSVVTSALTPLCGIGALPLEKMLPLTLGSNIGTCLTAMIASLVSLKFGAVQIAFCHLSFNTLGTLIFFPIPLMRRIPLGAARLLGLYASFFPYVPLIYILIAFIFLPAVVLGVSALFGASVAAGVVVTAILVLAFAVFEYLWIVGYPRGNALCYKVLPLADRSNGEKAEEAPQEEATPEPPAETSV